MNLQNIPDLVLQRIFEFVDTEELFKCLQVSRRFYKCLKIHWRWLKKRPITIRINNGYEDDQIVLISLLFPNQVTFHFYEHAIFVNSWPEPIRRQHMVKFITSEYEDAGEATPIPFDIPATQEGIFHYFRYCTEKISVSDGVSAALWFLKQLCFKFEVKEFHLEEYRPTPEYLKYQFMQYLRKYSKLEVLMIPALGTCDEAIDLYERSGAKQLYVRYNRDERDVHEFLYEEIVLRLTPHRCTPSEGGIRASAFQAILEMWENGMSFKDRQHFQVEKFSIEDMFSNFKLEIFPFNECGRKLHIATHLTTGRKLAVILGVLTLVGRNGTNFPALDIQDYDYYDPSDDLWDYHSSDSSDENDES